MKNVFSVLKINLLSLIALPVFVLAVCMKLLAKGFEKILVGIGALFLFLFAMLVAAVVQNPGEVLNRVFMVILVLVIGGIFTALIIFFFSVISSVIMAVANFIIGILDGIYKLLYGGYSALYRSCKACYEEELGDLGNPFVKGLACLIYSVVRCLNGCVIFFVTHALILLSAVCLLFAAGLLADMDRNARVALGIHLPAFLGMFPANDVAAGVILYLALVLCVSMILISLGLEWNEWGLEMKMATGDYEDYMTEIEETEKGFEDENSADEDREELLRCREYLDILNEHFDGIEGFQARTQSVIRQSDSQALSTLLGEYMGKLLELSKKMKSMPEQIPVEKFKKLIPQIRQLESLREDIRRMSAGLEEKTPRDTAEGPGFFAGCDTIEKLDKRYKALCRTYHPDSEAGDEDTFKRMQEEYERLKQEME